MELAAQAVLERSSPRGEKGIVAPKGDDKRLVVEVVHRLNRPIALEKVLPQEVHNKVVDNLQLDGLQVFDIHGASVSHPREIDL